MTADVIALKPAQRPDDREALLEAVVELHALITLDPILGAYPVRAYFVFNPQAISQIAASLGPGPRAATAYALVAYDFPFALCQLAATSSAVSQDRAKQIAACSAGLQVDALRAAAGVLGIDARPVAGFDAAALKAAFFPSTQETVIGVFQLELRRQ